MKKVKHEKSINLSNLLAEGLLTVVCEKNDLVWTVPFSVELHAQIVKDCRNLRFRIAEKSIKNAVCLRFLGGFFVYL